MKKTIYFLLFSLFLITSCEKDTIETEPVLELNSKAGIKVDVCHKGDNEINISINAVETHRAHGDAIDMDGDGYFDKENFCSEGVDCDDINPNVNPGMEEVCDNGIDDDYDGDIDEDCITIQIGDFYQGGIVFWIDPLDDCHGLVCAITDQSTGIQWYNGTDIQTGAIATEVGSGQSNTTTIITIQGNGNYAASICANYNDGTYSDWFLPSKDELSLIHTNLNLYGIGGFAPDRYWSSSEGDDGGQNILHFTAWFQDFAANFNNFGIKSDLLYVRAIRAF